MPAYVPILKAKPGEFTAWQNADAAVVSAARPLFEVVPTHGPERDLATFVHGVAANWHTGSVATVETGYLDQTLPVAGGHLGPIMWAAEALHARGVPARPVIRLDDDPVVLAEAAAADAMHRQGVCLRLGSEEADPDPAVADALITGVWSATGFTPAGTDLLIDFGEVDDARTVARVLPIAGAMLVWASASGPWRSVTVAAGAFPASISHLSTNTYTAIRRHDADMWSQLATSGSLPLVPDFGDYGVAHPSVPTPAPRGPLPNLRYTVGDEWWVWRETKSLPGNESFFTLCSRVTSSAAWPSPVVCWGDQQVLRCSGSTGGAGTATQWRAYGTSHHLAVIIHRLATSGAP